MKTNSKKHHVCEEEESTAAQRPGRSCGQAGNDGDRRIGGCFLAVTLKLDVRGRGSPLTSWLFQMGLFLDLDPEQMMMEENLDDPDLEAELAALTGSKAAAGGRAKHKGKSECKTDDCYYDT